jgi:hypothetical protein
VPVERQREGGLLSGWLILALAASLLTLESLLPGNAFLPLTTDDFPVWAAGKRPEDLRQHPHPNWNMSDVLHLFIPGLETTRDAWDADQLPPGWDPTVALGVPHVDQVHYSVYYPPAWLPLFIGLRGLTAMAWLHIMLAGVGMMMYLRALHRTQPAALVGALAFALSGWMTARLHAFPVVGAAVWLPWVLLGLERGAQTGRTLPYALAALSLMLSFMAGFPQISLMVAGMALLLEIVRFVSRRRRREPVGFQPVGVVAAFVLAGLLAAPQLLPTRDYVQNQSARTEMSAEEIAGDGLAWPLLTHLIAPDYYATTEMPGPHPLAMEAIEAARIAPVSVNRAETSMGIGVMGLLLALVALVFGKRWVTRTFAVVVVGCMTLLLVPSVLELFAGLLPPLRYGSPKRLLFLSTFGLSVLAAGGLDLLRQQRLRYVVMCWVTALASTALALTLVIGVPSTEEDVDLDRWALELGENLELGPVSPDDIYEVIPRDAFTTAADAAFRSASLAFAAALAAILLFRPRSAPSERGWVTRIESLPGLVPAIIGIELVLAAWPMLRAAPLSSVTTDPWRIGRLRVPQVASAARSTEPESFVPPRILRVGNNPSYLRPNFPGLFGLHDVQAYVPMVPLHVAELLDAVSPGMRVSGSILGGVTDAGRLARPAIDMLGVNVVLTDDPEVLPPGFEDHETVGQVRVLRNTQAMRRAFHASRFHVVSDPEVRVARLAEPDFQPRFTIVLGEKPQGLPDAEVFVDRGGVEDATVVVPRVPNDGPRPRNVTVQRYAPGNVRVAVGPGSPGMVVLSEAWHPGWNATVDGRKIETQAANHALVGVPVASAEKAIIELRFDPESYHSGRLFGMVGVAGLVLWLLVPFIVRRRNKVVLEDGAGGLVPARTKLGEQADPAGGADESPEKPSGPPRDSGAG